MISSNHGGHPTTVRVNGMRPLKNEPGLPFGTNLETKLLEKRAYKVEPQKACRT